MKKFIPLIIALFHISLTYGQDAKKIININPDKNGDPWIIEGYTPPNKSSELSIEDIKSIIQKNTKQNPSQLKDAKTLPTRIDNSKSIYMRPAFNQVGGSCGSSSRICYMFAYEINCYRKLNGSLKENKYPSHFTWLLTGQHSDKEKMAQHNGIPNSITYGGDKASDIYGGENIGWPNLEEAPNYGWMNGYDKWFSAMHNRIEKSGSFRLNSVEKLNLLKRWFFNHWNDSSFPLGGVAGAGCATKDAIFIKNNENKWIVKKWGPRPDHGTTWVGYDDEISYDFNGDGEITNDKDTNGDGKVNFKDWEKGALIMRNSWGKNWCNNGNIYVPYRFIDMHGAELYWIRKDYKPIRTMKISMNYDARSEIKISVGIASNLDAKKPEKTMECEHFKFAGNGKVPMLGKWADGKMHDENMEFGYDITDLTKGFDATKPLKYFLVIETKKDAEGEGEIASMSVLNYEEDTPKEYTSQDIDEFIENNGETTYVSVIMPRGKPIPSKYLPTAEWKLISVDSQHSSNPGKNAFDGNENTIWHTNWGADEPRPPHYISVDMGKEYTVSTFEYTPRQDGNDNGTIDEYELYISNDKNNWGEPVAKGKWGTSKFTKEIHFKTTTGRYFKLVALSEIKGRAWTSAAEIRFLKEHSTAIEPITKTNNIKAYCINKTLFIEKVKYPSLLKIYNIQGQLIISKNIGSGNSSINIPNSGIFIIAITNNELNFTKKVIAL